MKDRGDHQQNLEQQQQQQRWLLKTEPDAWSWENQAANSGMSVWDGVRSLQAQKLMKSMKAGELCFFYHTGKQKEVVGIVRVVKTFYPDPTDDTGKWGAVDVKEVEAFQWPVTLAQMKDDDHFKDFKMIRQPRLSVVPVEVSIWDRVCELGEGARQKSGSEVGQKGGTSKKKMTNKRTEAVEKKKLSEIEGAGVDDAIYKDGRNVKGTKSRQRNGEIPKQAAIEQKKGGSKAFGSSGSKSAQRPMNRQQDGNRKGVREDRAAPAKSTGRPSRRLFSTETEVPRDSSPLAKRKKRHL